MISFSSCRSSTITVKHIIDLCYQQILDKYLELYQTRKKLPCATGSVKNDITNTETPLFSRAWQQASEKLWLAKNEFDHKVDCTWSVKGQQWLVFNWWLLATECEKNFWLLLVAPHLRFQSYLKRHNCFFRKLVWLKPVVKFSWLLTKFLKLLSSPPFELQEFSLMSFGFRNAAQAFHIFIDDFFRNFKFMHADADDRLIASQGRESHLQY